MKVKDLISKLQTMDENAEVIVRSSNFELNGADVSVSFVHQYNEGLKHKETFRDAFDGGTYQKEIYSIIGGNEKVVSIS